jgi:hypothetical protein
MQAYVHPQQRGLSDSQLSIVLEQERQAIAQAVSASHAQSHRFAPGDHCKVLETADSRFAGRYGIVHAVAHGKPSIVLVRFGDVVTSFAVESLIDPWLAAQAAEEI